MKIGQYIIRSLETGRFALDGGAMFGVVPKNLWHKKNPADEQNRIDLALRVLLLRNGEKTILIDTGVGHKYDEKFQKIFKVDHSEYTLQDALDNEGIDRNEVTDIILTHLHFDHCGGTTIKKGENLELMFPNATHHVQEEQWDWANSPSEKDRASFLKDDFLLIKNSGKLNLLNAPGEILPGIESLVMYGHTRGMQMIKISDKHNTLLYCADLIPTASHIPLPWIMGYDNNPLITLQEKKKILPQISEQKWILVFEHDPFRPAATVYQDEKGFKMDQEIQI